jgi:hypothetical protein
MIETFERLVSRANKREPSSEPPNKLSISAYCGIMHPHPKDILSNIYICPTVITDTPQYLTRHQHFYGVWVQDYLP